MEQVDSKFPVPRFGATHHAPRENEQPRIMKGKFQLRVPELETTGLQTMDKTVRQAVVGRNQRRSLGHVLSHVPFHIFGCLLKERASSVILKTNSKSICT
jgi:hypothetical protein